MFEQLLKYPIDIFRQGDFYFGIRLPGLILFLIFVGLIAASIWAYRTTRGRTYRGFRGFLIFLRTLALCGLAFCLLKPFVTVYQTSPDDSYLAVLLDESKSMQVTDSVNQESRLSSLNNLLFDPEGGILNSLNEKFKTRLFSFSDAPRRMTPAALTEANGETTNIPSALNETLENLQGVPLSGVVIFSDGADASGEDITKLAFRMRDRKVPVHTVGIGSPEGIQDIEVVKVDAPRTAEEDFPVEIWATIRRKGYGPREVTVRLRDENRVVKTFNINLNKERATRRVQIKFIPRNPGTQKYVVEIPPEADEAVPQNNSKKFLLKVTPSKRVKILYVDGLPRKEIGAIRGALDNDPKIELTLRFFTSDTSIGGASRANEHQFDLYPTSKEVLFDYDAIIFGNIASSKFSRQQLENTAEFVRTRGGGFLMLGGSHSLGNHRIEDSYINTPIAEVLPVELELGTAPAPSARTRRFATPPRRTGRASVEGYQLQLTAEGRADPLMALADEPRENTKHWDQLSTLVGYSRVRRAKAGATVLAVHPVDRNEFGNRILVATHNYNAGRVMVFTPPSSWRWQMLTSHENEGHERFWRQTAKWLTTVQKDQLKLDIPKTSYALKEAVIINATAYDHQFELTNQAKVRVIITDEHGRKRELPLEQVLGQEGLYTARFIPPRHGEYRVSLIGTLGGKSLGEQSGLFEVAESYAEFTNAELNVELLQTLASTSGGRYYTLEDASQMVNHIPLVESATSRLVDEEVWDMPLIFGAVILLLGLEWFLRKRRGLA